MDPGSNKPSTSCTEADSRSYTAVVCTCSSGRYVVAVAARSGLAVLVAAVAVTVVVVGYWPLFNRF